MSAAPSFLYQDRLIAVKTFSSGSVYAISVNDCPISSNDLVEVIVDNNFFVRVVQGRPEYLALIQEFREQGFVINPLAAALEQVLSNGAEYRKKYLAFRRNYEFEKSYVDLALGGKEQLWIGLTSRTCFLRVLVIRCYILFFATLLARRESLTSMVTQLQTFVAAQPMRLPVIGFFLMLCAHVLKHEAEFRACEELPLIAKFFQIPKQLDDKTISDWARNRAADLYTLFAAREVIKGETPYSETPPTRVIVATSDNFLAKVYLRYCCVKSIGNEPFSVNRDQLMLLDPETLDLLPKPGATWAKASDGTLDRAQMAEHYFPCWDRLVGELRESCKLKPQ